MPRDDFQYIAFISYRHEAVGRKWAMWLQQSIENYRVPWALVKLGKAPRRLGKCFRDEEELAASSDLSKEIDAALLASKFLIVVCTPRTPHSRWVNEEIKRFRELGRGDQILALLVEGDPRESFPAALLEIRPSAATAAANEAARETPIQQVEPLAADIRDDVTAAGGHGRGHMRSLAKLRIIAGMLGVSFDDLYDRNSRRVYGRMLVTAGLALLVAVTMVTLAAYAFSQRAEAQTQRATAEKERDTAKFVGDFLLDDVLARANPNDIPDKAVRDVIREKMIDPAADRVGEKLRDRPLVEAEARSRLGTVYRKIGEEEKSLAQYRQAKEIAEAHLPEDSADRNAFVSDYAVRLSRAGRADEAEVLLKKSLEISRRTLGDDHIDTIRLMTNYGSALCNQEKYAEAEPILRDGHERARKTLGEDDTETTFAANEYARLLRSTKKLQEAERVMRAIYESRRRKLGAEHTDTLSAEHNLAFVQNDLNQLADAEPRCREVLGVRMKKLGAKHPDTLSSMHLYAQILRKTGDAVDAEKIAGFLVASAADAPPARAKSFATTWAQCLDQLGRTEDAARVRRERGIEPAPASSQPRPPQRALEGEAARFVEELLRALQS